jgi:hypothetical protein
MSTPVMSPVNPVTPVTLEAERIIADEAKVLAGKTTKPADTKDCSMEDATSDAPMVSCAKHVYVAAAAVNHHLPTSERCFDCPLFLRRRLHLTRHSRTD